MAAHAEQIGHALGEHLLAASARPATAPATRARRASRTAVSAKPCGSPRRRAERVDPAFQLIDGEPDSRRTRGPTASPNGRSAEASSGRVRSTRPPPTPPTAKIVNSRCRNPTREHGPESRRAGPAVPTAPARTETVRRSLPASRAGWPTGPARGGQRQDGRECQPRRADRPRDSCATATRRRRR